MAKTKQQQETDPQPKPQDPLMTGAQHPGSEPGGDGMPITGWDQDVNDETPKSGENNAG